MTQVTVDGVMQGNGGSTDEERGNGFERGGWAMGKDDDETRTFITQTYQRADAFLLGQRTYEIFAGSWGGIEEMRDHPIGTLRLTWSTREPTRRASRSTSTGRPGARNMQPAEAHHIGNAQSTDPRPAYRKVLNDIQEAMSDRGRVFVAGVSPSGSTQVNDCSVDDGCFARRIQSQRCGQDQARSRLSFRLVLVS